MEWIRRNILMVFWVILFIHCLFHVLHLPFVGISKLLLIPSLLVYLFTRRKEDVLVGINFFYLVAILFAFIGDMLLVIINDLLFLPGMISYIVNLFFLCIFFLQLQKIYLRQLMRPLLVVLVLSVIGYFVYGFLGEKLKQFQLPVLIYMVFVAITAALAMNTTQHPQLHKTGWYFFIGILVFILSNTILVLNRFHFLYHNLYVAVMLTYGSAQYLLARGVALVSKDIRS
ncbi:lysoplasmalogenase family protein [Sediminibacterium sp.]|uniref:lysoplasmalogenase family protein n=1 Tax=Sediminibacterium sp. TaxID=1917865 RepID=UPI003F6F9F24